MPIDAVDIRVLQDAVQIYLDVAWGPEATRHWPPIDFGSCATMEDALGGFQEERPGNMRRYTLRLGNMRYPFMKLVFQELLIRDRFFFSVDSHDDMDVKQSYSDYERWLEVKRYNQRIKEEIERSWQEASVPTFEDVVAQVEKETPPGPGAAVKPSAPLILVVDDDVRMAQGVQAILSRIGYRIRRVVSGEEAIEALAEEVPSLILSDLEMGGMSGLDLANRIRMNPATAPIPFILATAASIDPSNFRVIDGFLVKPYEDAVLVKFVSRHLPPPISAGEAPKVEPGGQP